MPIRKGAPTLIRIVTDVRGTVPMLCRLHPRFNYGALPPWSMKRGCEMVATVRPDLAILRAPADVAVDSDETSAAIDVAAGERLAFVLSYVVS